MSVTDLGPQEQEFERTPPHDITAEQGVLGGMLLSQDAIAEVIEVLRTQDFYRPAHQIIFDVILDLYGRGDPADAVTVAGELTKRGEIGRVGGAPYLHTLISSVPTAANAGYYAKIVRERSVLRKLVETGTRIVQMGYAADGADADEVLDRAQAEVFAIAEKRTGEDYVPLSEIMPGALDEIEAIGSRGGQMVGVPTGFADLDALTNGLHAGQMIVVAARPAMGKALSLDTPLPTPAGWTTMGEVEVGDMLIGADGRPTRVVAATEVMSGRPCYEIEFSDGEVIVADAEHQWRTSTRESRRRRSRRKRGHHGAELPVGRAVDVASGRHKEAVLAVVDGSSRASHTVTALGTWPGFDHQPRSRGYRSQELAGTLLHRIARPGCADEGGFVTAAGAGTVSRTGRTIAQAGRFGAAGTPVPTISDTSGNVATAVQHDPIKTTAQIAATLRCDGDNRPNHAVAVAAPFHLPPVDLPIDPYVLGAWLGGGSGGHVDEEIAGAGQPVVRHATLGDVGPSGLRTRLRELGLLGGKHIPGVYLRASEEQRRALLAGLLDTHGHVSETGRVQLGLTNRRLAEDARELILTLGYQATMTTEQVNGRSEDTSMLYRIGFTPAEPVFRLPRKAARLRRTVRPESRVRYIVDVRPVESVPVRCVQVDNDDHMYLAGRSCIPTHNSTLALDFARAASIKHGLTSAFFSLEMGRNEITMRLLSAEARVALHAMRSGTMTDEDWTRLARRMSEVAEAPLFIDDSPNMSMMEIRAKCRRLKQQHDLRLVIVDYLQLMTSGKRVESRQVEVSEFSRSLKLLAKELGVPVIALSQLNRGPEQRTDKKPMVSDLRESGSIEQDADMVILLHREDAYEKESPRAGEADLIVAKHRNGPTATVTVAFQGHYSRFVDMAQ
ncbi:replicative DNA helicase [Actinomadura miaoliensis]|uniref:replicative DNA helicase n=1 Tax=Actinomadura miaoliensis TaxID=430685 RepID=UPI0031F02A47